MSNSTLNKENLGYLGIDFQYAALKALIEDPELLQKTHKFLDQNMFSDPYLRMIVGSLKDYFKSINMVPTYKELKSYMRSKLTREDDAQFVDETIEKARKSNEFSIEYVSKQLTEFMRWRKQISILQKSLEKCKGGWDERSFNTTVNGLEELRNFGQNKTVLWHFDEETVKKTLEQSDEDIVPTYIKEIDELVGGGLLKRAVGLVAASTGVGKTTFGTILAHNAAVNGHKVLQIYFEDRPQDIMRKHLAIQTDSRIPHLKGFDPSKTEEFIKNELMNDDKWIHMYDNLVMLRMANKETTVEDIENEIIMLANTEDFRPDVIIIDYFACLKYSANPIKNTWEAQSDCMRKIVQNIAFKYRAAVWVMEQTNREGTKEENQGRKANVSGSYDATHPAEIWLEISRTKEQWQAMDNRANLTIVKARHGISDFTFSDILLDNGRVRIDCRDSKSYREDDMPEFKLKK